MRSRLFDFELAGKFLQPIFDAGYAHTGSEAALPLNAAPVVRDDDVELLANPAKLHQYLGSGRMAIDVSQGFLDDAEEGPL